MTWSLERSVGFRVSYLVRRMDTSFGNMMILQTLGSIRLVRDDGTEMDELLRQPKRFALLAYLASPRPGVWHRRDVLLAVFWPNLDTPHARTALRNALYVLRQQLSEGVVRTRGDEDVSIDPARVTSDVAMLEADLAAGRFGDALGRFGGDVLPGLHVGDSEGFEAWVDEERLRTRALARSAGLGLANACEQTGDAAGAADALARVMRIEPVDESIVRRVIALLDRSGDRARALDVYERFRARLAEEFEAEPAAETVRLADEIRASRAPVREAPARVERPAQSPAVPPTVIAPEPPPAPASRRRTRRLALSAGLLLAATAVAFGLTRHGEGTPKRRELIVLPMENATGRTDLEYLAAGLDDEVASRLRGIGGLEKTKSAARSTWAATPASFSRITLRVELAFRGKLTLVSDSFVVTGQVVDVASGQSSDAGRFAFLVDQVSDVASRVAAGVAGAIFREPLPEMPRDTRTHRGDGESFRLTLKGWHELLTDVDEARAKETFLEAIALDPSNARARAGLSSAWAALSLSTVPFDEGSQRAEQAATEALALDPNEGTALANLAFIRGMRARSLPVAESLFAKATEADPGNPEIYMVKAALYRHAWNWTGARDAARMARELNPLSAWYVDREAVVTLCIGDATEALRLYRVEASLNLADASIHWSIARTLARLGQWDDATAEILSAFPPKTRSDSAFVDTLARGERGYLQLVHANGRRRLNGLLAQASPPPPAVQLVIARIAAGDIDTGLDELTRLAQRDDVNIYRMRCHPDMEEVRSSPRFQRIMDSLPKWKLDLSS